MTREISDLDPRSAPIDLAHAPAFELGPLTVRPSTRELVGRDGASEVLEPRVMQVLVALARADGAILTRDDLTASCWEGRIVGEDAINRVISRLRRSADGIGQGAFRIETVTKVGYRLTLDGAQPQRAQAEASATSPSASRRTLIGAGAAATAVAAIGGALWFANRRHAQPSLPDDVRALYSQGWLLHNQGSTEQNSAAVAAFRAVTERAPTYADGWGALAFAYEQWSQMASPDQNETLRAHARSAAARALQLEPHNALAEVAKAEQLPMSDRSAIENALRKVLARHPDCGAAWQGLHYVLFEVGRVAEAVQAVEEALSYMGPSPSLFFRRTIACMSSDQLEAADRSAEQAINLYPRHYGVWFTTFYLYLYTGRAAQALTFAANIEGRPPGIPVGNFDQIIAVAKAALSRADRDIDSAMRMNLAAAHMGAGYAENAMLAASYLGRLDTAFEIAEAYFFGRGFDPGRRSFSAEQGYFYQARRTYILFQLGAAPMRADPRFEPLVEEIGLKRYWAQSRSTPDYLKKA